MATQISANNALSSYALFDATDIKSFIIDQLRKNPNNPFKDASYLGSNINAFIDIIAVMLQQLLFAYSVNASETSFSTAVLYENMAKIVSILNYKCAGKQTSLLPVQITITRPAVAEGEEPVNQVIIPKFTTISHNYQYVLPQEELVELTGDTTIVNTVMYQGAVQEMETYIANGDEYELIRIPDNYITEGQNFITDNFFTVYVDEYNTGNWKEYKETSSLFLENSNAEKYEKRFTEDFGYEFKFGNGSYGKKLPAGAKVIIYYLLSNGEAAVLGDTTFTTNKTTFYASTNYTAIANSPNILSSITTVPSSWISITNSGPATSITYPESVESIRKNAPKIFASQGRLFNLADYETYINQQFSSYCKDTYLCDNSYYTGTFLKYYYDIGMAAPQEDSRVALAQVDFMNANNFNNIYCFLVPAINTFIDGKVPNYLNGSLKKQIVNKCKPQMGIAHNLVIVDPIYKAFTFGTIGLDDTHWNDGQLKTKLILIKNSNTKYSDSYIKSYCVDSLKTYFNSLTLNSTIDTAMIGQLINTTPGVKGYCLLDSNDNLSDKLFIYIWNPLYKNEDNMIISYPYSCQKFEMPYFYDLDNLEKLIIIKESV